MAKSQTFGKRENEKKKQAKRLEKQKRREERQAGGSSSLDDMIAYVDENGNITDTPPQLRPKVGFLSVLFGDGRSDKPGFAGEPGD